MRDKTAFSDVTLRVGERSSFPCSKFILAARSEVFRAMFELPMRESIENEVRIEDAEPSAVEDMLEYVYTDGILHLTLEVGLDDQGLFFGMIRSTIIFWLNDPAEMCPFYGLVGQPQIYLPCRLIGLRIIESCRCERWMFPLCFSGIKYGVREMMKEEAGPQGLSLSRLLASLAPGPRTHAQPVTPLKLR